MEETILRKEQEHKIFRWVKNHKTVIKALSKIDCESVIYLICGVGYKKEELKNGNL